MYTSLKNKNHQYLIFRCFRIIAQTREFPAISTMTSMKRMVVMATAVDMTDGKPVLFIKPRLKQNKKKREKRLKDGALISLFIKHSF